MIKNMQYAINQVISAKHEQKPLFACLFCGGVKSCEQLKSTGVNALCLSWAQNNEKPKLSKIVPLLDSLILKSGTLTNTLIMCSEFITNQRLSEKIIKLVTETKLCLTHIYLFFKTPNYWIPTTTKCSYQSLLTN